MLAIILNKRPKLDHYALREPYISYRAKCLHCYWNQHFLPQIWITGMHVVAIQYKTFLYESKEHLNVKQEHTYLLIVAIKKGAVNDNV